MIFINIEKTKFDADRLNDLIENLANQNCSHISVNFITGDSDYDRWLNWLLSCDVPFELTLNKQFNNQHTGYYICLRITDFLLPNALLQWQSIMLKGDIDAVILSYLDHHDSLENQVLSLFKKNSNQIKQQPMLQLLDKRNKISSLKIEDQVFLLPLLQKFSVISKKASATSVLGNRNVLYDLSKFKSLNDVMYNLQKIIRLEIPTIVLSQSNLVEPKLMAEEIETMHELIDTGLIKQDTAAIKKKIVSLSNKLERDKRTLRSAKNVSLIDSNLKRLNKLRKKVIKSEINDKLHWLF